MEDPLLPQPTAQPEEGLGVDRPRRLYPDAFYCPLTRKAMEDPVVGPDGDSFERSAVLERDAAGAASQRQQMYYSNRALQIIINKEKQQVEEQGTVLGSLPTGLVQVLEKAALATDDHRPLPDAYYCPITLDIMTRPAIDPDGNTYERRAILSWIWRNGKSPLTRSKMSAKELRDNHVLKDLIELEVNKEEYSNHSVVLRWKQSRKEM